MPTVTQSPPAGTSTKAVLATLPLVRVVDDEAAIQALITNMGPIGGFAVSAHTTAGDLLANLDESRIGCLVIDLFLPDMTGIELLEQLAGRGCALPVVFTSGMARVSEAVKAIKLGSIDFLEKPFGVEAMVAAIQRAIELDRERRHSGATCDGLRRRFARLSPRESQVMELVVQGAANKEVAHRLGLSPKTVEVHRANVMRKTEAASLAELVRMHVAIRG
jgi:two-component system, LuxR family, response regulator FixJ